MTIIIVTIIIGTQTEQIVLKDVCYIMTDTCELRLHTDGEQAVIEEVKKMRWNKRKFIENLFTLAIVLAFNGVIFWLLCEWVMEV